MQFVAQEPLRPVKEILPTSAKNTLNWTAAVRRRVDIFQRHVALGGTLIVGQPAQRGLQRRTVLESGG